uniref:Beta-galactosidase n=1 Tax=Ananas comosus var. bracteatus TaxID=296719 RepID=A0A6V7QLH5_ANACO|nr:unnamed protein product [Ananas comosus var. bracteatus]
MALCKVIMKLLGALLVLVSLSCFAQCTNVGHDGRAITIDGERRILLSGAIHYPRSTPGMWPDLLRKAKEGGLDAVETYVFWNGHEPRRRQYNFEGRFDIVRFLKEVQNAGLYAVLRIGPYVCAEWNYGGLPAWLREIPGLQFRTNNKPFENEMQNFTTLIVDKIKSARLLAPQGGPIILTQIENEYGNIMGPYGDAGKKYIKWCANLAESLGVGVPWIMCQQSDAPQPMINTCNGFYCDEFTPNNPKSPKMWTENWTGWFKAWDKPDPSRPAEDVAFAVARFFQKNGTFQNYYMYHGGTNFARSTGGPYITTTYDYDAPLDEYGNIRQPKWGHLKELHAVLKSIEKQLTYGDVNEHFLDNGIAITKFTFNGKTACFISNRNETTDATVNYEGTNYFVPAWSVSILPDGKTVAYNTAKITAQTSIMVKKPNQAENEPTELKWSWRPEFLRPYLTNAISSSKANELLEQIITTSDKSDYLWYMTSVDHPKSEEVTLYVNTTGHILYAFVNDNLVGAQYSPNGPFGFEFQRSVTLQSGTNHISLLSATVGLKNYGYEYELMPAGIVGGPVKLIGKDSTVDLSKNTWSYQIGLDGEGRKVYLNPNLKWLGGMIPTKRPFTWYKTTFQAPLSTEPVVVDLLGLGKGEAWVNGNSIGRFWPNYTASADGCVSSCNYRGSFQSNKCQSGCGQPAQRWYHVPRSFLTEGEPNTLVLFEEAGGDPSQVNFQTVTVGTVCATADQGSTLSLSCQGGYISNIEVAGVGELSGTCGSLEAVGCVSDAAYSALSQACIGNESCAIEVTGDLLGECKGIGGSGTMKLTVQATC